VSAKRYGNAPLTNLLNPHSTHKNNIHDIL
jgi:hypothetical protein